MGREAEAWERTAGLPEEDKDDTQERRVREQQACNSEPEKYAQGEPAVAERHGYGDREMGGRKLQFL